MSPATQPEPYAGNGKQQWDQPDQAHQYAAGHAETLAAVQRKLPDTNLVTDGAAAMVEFAQHLAVAAIDEHADGAALSMMSPGGRKRI